MAIPKTLLQIAMQSTRVIKPYEKESLDYLELESTKEVNKSKLTFRKDSTDIIQEKQKNTNVNNSTDVFDKSIVTSQPDLIMLSHSEKKILAHLCVCKEKQDSVKITTKPINLSVISKEIGIPITTIKKSIQRLEKKSFLNRLLFKPGRDGWTIYSISTFITKALFQ